MNEVALAKIVAGILLLILGRRLFWLFVGLIGFWAGMVAGESLFPHQTGLMQLLIPVLCGIAGILLAVFLQRIAIAVGGFLAGGYLALSIVHQTHSLLHQSDWIVFAVGGIIGAILMSVLFDWALIFLSSAAGSTLLVESLHVRSSYSYLLFVALLVIGIVIQAGIHSARQRRLQPG
jgi:Domain of unknown function (DUF4203)